MRLRVSGLAAAVLALLAASLSVAPARADGIDVVSQSVQNKFPQGLQFNLFVTAGGDITDARLHYRLGAEPVEAQVKGTCTPGRSSNCTASVGNTPASYLVPGANLTYFWELRDSAGGTLRTPDTTAQYMDDRFQWQSTTQGKITAYYHSGSEQGIAAILQAGNDAVNRMSALLQTNIDFQIKLWLYDNARELASAASPNSQATGGVLEGQVVAADTALAARDSDTLDTVRHELTHVVVGRASRGFIVPVPTWVNEGLAVFAQNALSPGWQQALDLAIRRNRPLPIESLSDSTRSNADFSLFYAESGSLVRFLVETYGDAKFGQFFAALGRDTLNGALKSVYGFDQFGLEDAWRRSVGLPPASIPAAPTTAPSNSQAQRPAATPAPSGQAAEKSSGSGGGDGLVIAIAVVTAFAALALLGAGVYVARKAR
jgi:hypothetical protein